MQQQNNNNGYTLLECLGSNQANILHQRIIDFMDGKPIDGFRLIQLKTYAKSRIEFLAEMIKLSDWTGLPLESLPIMAKEMEILAKFFDKFKEAINA